MEAQKEDQGVQPAIQDIQPLARRKQPTSATTAGKEHGKRAVRSKGPQSKGSQSHGQNGRTKVAKDRKLRANLQRSNSKYKDAVESAKDAEILLSHGGGFLEAETELERTYKVRQDEIQKAVGIQQAKKAIDLKLDLGPYVADYTRNGRNLLLAGRKGHIATCEWRAGKPGCELHLNETVRDAKWLHNNQYFAVAQKKYTYIYDQAGVEIHCLKQYVEASHLTFLPYHFLLAGIENSGFLRYTDTSTGQIVAEHPTRKGAPTALAQNPWNAILHLGHQNGTVSLWSPNSTTPLVKIQAHAGPVRSAAIDRSGHYMLSGGQDRRLKLWDIRTFKEVHSYSTYHPASSISISDRGLTAIGCGTTVNIWKDLFTSAPTITPAPTSSSSSSSTITTTRSQPSKIQSPYLTHRKPSTPTSHLSFCPYEDILGLSHSNGFSQILVPGAGEPNFDALEANPYETSKQRQESEVKALLDKLQPDTIALDPDFVGNLDARSAAERKAAAGGSHLDLDGGLEGKQGQDTSERQGLDGISNEDGTEKDKDKDRNRGRGRNSALKRYLRRKGKGNVIDEKRLKVDALKRERMQRGREKAGREKEVLGPALARFVRGKG